MHGRTRLERIEYVLTRMRAAMRSLKSPWGFHAAHHTDNAIRKTLYISFVVTHAEHHGCNGFERSTASISITCSRPRVGDFTALGGSQLLPERLALISYIIEYAFIYDDGESLPSTCLLILLRKC